MCRVYAPDEYPVALAESTLGQNLVGQGKFEEAESLLLRSHAIILAAVGSRSHWLAQESLVRVVGLYDAWERPAEGTRYRGDLAGSCAASRNTSQWSVLRPAMGPELRRLAEALDLVNEGCGGVGYSIAVGKRQTPGLEATVARALAVRAETLANPDDPRTTALARLFLGWANAIAPEKHVEARRLMARDALALLAPRTGAFPTEVAEAHALLAETQDREEVARGHAREAARLLSERGAATGFTTAAEIRIARALAARGMYPEAERILVPGYEALVAQLGPAHGDTLLARRMIHDLYTAWDRPADAERFADRVQPAP